VSEVGLVKVPVPAEEVQVASVEFTVLEPAVIFTPPAFEQVVTAVPALAVGGG